MFTVIAFDISDDRARARVVKVLREYAVRVQKSVFEAPSLTRPAFERLRADLEKLIDLRTDKIRFYFLCGGCIERIEMSGRGQVTQDPEFRVI